ncbi:unnamed protein product, partial [Prorocentrum cordatum]
MARPGLWVNSELAPEALQALELAAGDLVQVGVLGASWASQGSEIARVVGGSTLDQEGLLFEFESLGTPDACFEWCARARGENGARPEDALLHVCTVQPMACRATGPAGWAVEHVSLIRPISEEEEALELLRSWGCEQLPGASGAEESGQRPAGRPATAAPAVPKPARRRALPVLSPRAEIGPTDDEEGSEEVSHVLEEQPRPPAGPRRARELLPLPGPLGAGRALAALPTPRGRRAPREDEQPRSRSGGRGGGDPLDEASVGLERGSADGGRAAELLQRRGGPGAEGRLAGPQAARSSQGAQTVLAARAAERAAAGGPSRDRMARSSFERQLCERLPGRRAPSGDRESDGEQVGDSEHEMDVESRGAMVRHDYFAAWALDVVMQEFKARTLAIKDGGWHAAQWLALVPMDAEPCAASRLAAAPTAPPSSEVRHVRGECEEPVRRVMLAEEAVAPRPGGEPSCKELTRLEYIVKLVDTCRRGPGSFQVVENLFRSARALDRDIEQIYKGCCEGLEWVIICGLNFEAGGRKGGSPAPWPRAASLAQRAALGLISEAAPYFCRGPLAALEELEWGRVVQAKALAYSGQEVERGCPLVLGELLPGLLAAGLAGSVSALDLAAPRVQKWLLDPTTLLKPPSEWPTEVPKASVQVASDEEWYCMCEHPVRVGIFEPFEEEEAIFSVGGAPVLAGAFAVVKTGTPATGFSKVTRLIINMVPQNAYQRIVGAFHLYSLPPQWRGYMAVRKQMPGARVGRPDLKWACMSVAVIPMGWLSAVGLFQHLHRRLGIGDGPPSARFAESSEWRRDRPLPLFSREQRQAWVQYYLDDFDTPEIVPESVATMIENTIGEYQLRQREAYSKAGVPWADKKAACRQRRLVRMGSLVDGTAGRVGVTIEDLLDVGRMALWLLEQTWVTPKACLMVLERLARVFEFRRPLFATLNQVWVLPGLRAATASAGKALVKPFKLPAEARAELLSAVSLLPMAYADMRAALDAVVLATDASEEGGGLCYATGLAQHGAQTAAQPVGEEGLAFTPRGAMSSRMPRALLQDGATLPTVVLFDLFGGVGASMVALSRCPCRVVMYVSSEIDKAAKRCVRQRWPGVIELGDITKVTSEAWAQLGRVASEVAPLAVIAAGSPCTDPSGLNAAGQGLSGSKSGLFFGLPWAFKAIEQARAGVIDITDEEKCLKVKLRVSPSDFPAWAEGGWGLLEPEHALPTFAKLQKRKSPPAPVVGIKSASEAAIARWTEASCVSQVYIFEDEDLLWNTGRAAWRIPSAGERETLMGFDRGCTRAAVKAKQGAPPIVPCLQTGIAPEALGRAPDFKATEIQDQDLEQQLVRKNMRIASRGGTDVRLDLQAPFRAKAWPRSGLQASLWTWSIGRGYPWREDGHINELEVGAAVNAVKWRWPLVSWPRAGAVRDDWGWMRGRAAYLLAAGCYPMYACIDAGDNPADVPSRWFDGCRRLPAFWAATGKRPRLVQEVDEGVAAYIEHVWRTNGSLLQVNNTLAAVPFLTPRMSGKLKLSWKPQKAWLRLEPNVRALLLSPLCAAAIAGAFCWWGHGRAAAMLLAGYACILRSGEMLRLRRRDVRVFRERGVAILALRKTKTSRRGGRSELAVVRSQAAVRMLVKYVAPLAPDEFLLGSPRSEFAACSDRLSLPSEIALCDDAYADQGTGIVCTLGSGKVGDAISAEFVCSSDAFYAWWMENEVKDKKGEYHFCSTSRDRCKFKGKDVVHVDGFWLLEGADMTAEAIKWLKGPGGLREHLERHSGPAGAPGKEEKRPAGEPAPAVAGQLFEPPGAGGPNDLQKDLRELREAVRGATDKRAGRDAGRRGSDGGRRERRDGPERGRCREQPRSQERRDGPERHGHSRQRRRSRERRRSQSARGRRSAGAARDAFAPPAGGRAAGSRDEGTSAELPLPARAAPDRRAQEQRAERDRPDDRQQQRGPGSSSDALLLQHPEPPSMGPRYSREARTVCRALDLLAQRKYGECADLLAQRLKALERALVDGHLDRAIWCELIAPDSIALMDRDEDRMLATEQQLEQRLRQRPAWIQPSHDKGSGKGKDKDKGKGKNRATCLGALAGEPSSAGAAEDLRQWRCALRTRSVGELALPALGRVLWGSVCRLPTPSGEFVRASSSSAKPGRRRRSLLPLPVVVFAQRGGCHPSRPGRWSEGHASRHRLVGHALNFPGSRMGQKPGFTNPPREASLVQEKAMDRLSLWLEWFLSEDDEPPPPVQQVVQEAGQARVQCDGRAAGIRRDLVADLVFPTWPDAGEVHGSQEEWDKLVKEGLRRGLFREAAPAAFVRGRAGHPIFSGGMGVDKEKVDDGVPRSFLRFVSILTPLNEHTRPIQGDVDFLPFIAQAMLVVLEEDESAVVDSEDAFRVLLTTVPMGWSGAVAVVQAVVRRLVFGEAGVDLATEVAKSKAFPNGPNYSFVYLDSFDFIRVRVRALAEAMAGQESPEHRRFVGVCRCLGLPLNKAKSLIGSFQALLQGGEFDGAAGICAHRRWRGRHLLRLSLGIAAAEVATDAALRHWAGLACFCAGYRRPLFSILQDIFTVIDSPGRQGPVHASALEELLLLSALVPLAGANLRAQMGPHISCSDASPHGGGAAVADSLGALGATPAFAEVSGDAGASLSEAVHRRGVSVLAPFAGDLGIEGARGQCARLRRLALPGEHCYWDHLEPICALLERQAGGLGSGPLRSSRRPLGAAGASGDHRSRLRASNELAGLAIRALEARLVRPGFAVVSHPAAGSGDSPGHWMHNSFALHRRVAERLGQQGEVCEDELWDIYADVVAAACRTHGEASCPQEPGQQALWLSAQLREATERLGDAQLNEVMVQEIMDWLSAMQAGGEEGHLRDLVRAADHRGSDVRLWASE